MKRRENLLLFLFLLLSAFSFSQNENPYKSIGKKSKVISLTNGKYDEFFDLDSIQHVGSALINIHTMEVVKLLNDSQNTERFQTDRHSRFLSVDPLTHEYPELSPYQYASNSPVTFFDRDGAEASFRMPDGTAYVQPPSDHLKVPIPQYIRDHGVFMGEGIKPGSPTKADRVESILLDFIPVVGEFKMAAEFALGADVTTGESSPRMMSLPIIKETRTINKVAKAEEQIVKAKEVQKTASNVKKAAQLEVNKRNSIRSEEIVMKRLEGQIGENQTILNKPRIYLKDNSYTTPDFLIYNIENNEINQIIEAKNGGADFSNNQKRLSKEGENLEDQEERAN